MVIEFLNELRSEFLEKKYNLESEKKNLDIKLDENNKFIQRLNEESEQNFNAFSPRNQNVKLENSIKELEKERQTLLNKLNEINDDLESLSTKLEQFDIVLKTARQEKEARVITINSIDNDIVQKMESLIHKLEFCSKIVFTDHLRCKTELSVIIKNLYEILSDMEDISHK